MVRFGGAEASPAITPSWKSNSWAAPTAARLGKGDPGARSPDLKADMGELLDEEELKVNEKQLDRDWYDRCGPPPRLPHNPDVLPPHSPQNVSMHPIRHGTVLGHVPWLPWLVAHVL